MIDTIFKWGNLNLQTRYNILIGAIVVVLGYVIIHLNTNIKALENEIRTNTVDCNARIDAIRDSCDREISLCKESFLEYLKNNEKEVRDILFEAKKIKEVVYEDVN